MGATAKEAENPDAAKALPKQRAFTRGKVGVVAPQVIARPKPTYPATLKAQGIEGDVVLEVRIDARGAIVAVRVVRGANEKAFNEAAVAAARSARYGPATERGKAIPYTLTYTVKFRIDRQ